jgi:hypothetical protein
MELRNQASWWWPTSSERRKATVAASQWPDAATPPGSESTARSQEGPPGTWEVLILSAVDRTGTGTRSIKTQAYGASCLTPWERTASTTWGTAERRKRSKAGGRQEVGASRSTKEAGEPSPRDPVEGRGRRCTASLEGKIAGTPIPETDLHKTPANRQLFGDALARANGSEIVHCGAGCGKSARPDLKGAGVGNHPGLPDPAPLIVGGRSVPPGGVSLAYGGVKRAGELIECAGNLDERVRTCTIPRSYGSKRFNPKMREASAIWSRTSCSVSPRRAAAFSM